MVPMLIGRFDEGLRQTVQSAVHHAEGNVLEHTQMVCEALEQLPEYQALSTGLRNVVSIAATLHDIGKIHTTRWEDGDWHAPNHAPVGSRMAREYLWTSCGWCGQREAIQLREAVCLLIRYHSFPPVAIDADDVRVKLHRMAANGLLTPYFSIRLLCMLAKTDILGRRCPDQQELLDKIAMCEELANEEGCYDGCYHFPSPHTRRAFLSGRDVWKDQELFDDCWGEVVMMSGLPGTGKDTWIRSHVADLPMVSLDDIRKYYKISPKDNQGKVANIARDQAKEYLRQHQPFVWNATNITRQMREQLIALFETYHARVRVVYLETDWKTLNVRNHSREDVVPQSAVMHLLKKMALPEAGEATTVEWIAV